MKRLYIILFCYYFQKENMEKQKRKNHDDEKSENTKVLKLHDIKDENLKNVDKFETKYFIKTGFQSNCRLILDQAGSVIVYQPQFFIHHQSELLEGVENNIKTTIPKAFQKFVKTDIKEKKPMILKHLIESVPWIQGEVKIFGKTIPEPRLT